MKKLFTFLLALMAGAGTLFAASGMCGDNLTWDLTDGVLTISGTGSMANWTGNPHAPWYADRTSIQSVVINEGVTSIGDAAFFNCTALSTVTVPQSVTRVGDNVFVGCSALTAINVASGNAKYCSSYGALFNKEKTKLIRFPAGMQGTYTYAIPDGVTLIGEYAFQRSLGMTSVIIPGSVNEIGWNAFDGCENLTSITCNAVTPPDCGNGNDRFDKVDPSIPVYVPEGTVDAYKAAPGWSDFTNIQTLCVGTSGTCGKDGKDNLTWEVSCDGVLTISGEGEMANWDKYHHHPWVSFDVKSVVIKEGVTSIGDYAFRDCSQIRFISIPNSVKSVWGYAFLGCNGLESVDLGSSVTNIGSYAFEGCTALTSVVIPKSVTSIGEAPFRGCSSLESIVVEAGCVGYDSRDNCNAIIDKTNSWLGPLLIQGCKNTVVPTGFQLVISNYAFSGTGLTSLELPQGVTSIREYAFQNCSSLTSITIPSRVSEISAYTFSGCSSLSSITILGELKTIGNYAFDGCSKLADFAIPATVTSIGKYAFRNCSSLTSVTIPDGMYYTDESVFSNCAGLIILTLHKNINSLGANSFYNCKGLQEIHCYAVTPPTCKTDALYGVSSSTKLYVPEESVETYSNTTPWKNFNVTAIPLPYGTCGDNITWNVTDSVLTISGTGAMNCSEPWSFYSPSIKSLVIGEGVTDLGNIYFTDCSSLVSIEVAAGNPAFSTIDGVLFNKDKTVLIQYPVGNKRAEYIIPATVDSIGAASFELCENLTSVIIPASVTKIGEIAFYGCTGLQSITCESSIPPVCSKLCYFTDYCFMCFDGVDKESVILYVPKGSVAAYQEAEEWSNFKNIQPNPVIGQGTCGAKGDNLTWILMSDGVLTISGKGDMVDGDGHDLPLWLPYASFINSVVIEEGVTSIGDYAFSNCDYVTAVTIPNTVVSIGDYAFHHCRDLMEVEIPNSVTGIGDCAFANSMNLALVTIGSGVKNIGERAFAGCENMTSITCTGAPAACGEDCFLDVDKSIPLNVPEDYVGGYENAKEWEDFTNIQGVKCDIASGVFAKNNKISWRISCNGTLFIEGNGIIPAADKPYVMEWDEYRESIKKVIISEGITEIGTRTFGNLFNAEFLLLPNSLKTIGAYAFNGWDSPNLETIIIPNSVTTIGDGAFSGCIHVGSIILGYGVKTIGEFVFAECYKNQPYMICLAVQPPACGQGLLSHQSTEVGGHTLYVPAESVNKYKTTNIWKEFDEILPLHKTPGTHIIASGTIGDITWELDSNGILTIRGAGNLPDWTKPAPKSVGKHYLPAEDPTAPWYPYLSEILYIVIESGITGIGDYAFYGCVNVQSITCYATTPPACGEGAFGGIAPSIPLNVPESSVDAYKDAAQWKEFDVQADENQSPTAIDKVQSDNVPCTKVLRNGQLYLLYDGHIFDVRGQIVE